MGKPRLDIQGQFNRAAQWTGYSVMDRLGRLYVRIGARHYRKKDGRSGWRRWESAAKYGRNFTKRFGPFTLIKTRWTFEMCQTWLRARYQFREDGAFFGKVGNKEIMISAYKDKLTLTYNRVGLSLPLDSNYPDADILDLVRVLETIRRRDGTFVYRRTRRHKQDREVVKRRKT